MKQETHLNDNSKKIFTTQ